MEAKSDISNIAPLSTEIGVDEKLNITIANEPIGQNNGMGKDKDSLLVKAIADMVGESKIPVTYDINSATEFPDPHNIAVLAHNAYKDARSDMTFLDGWKLVATAVNTETLNGYFGAAFMNPERHQIVIAHRGTKPISAGAVWTDAIGILFNYTPKQIESACTFSKKVGLAAKAVENELGLRFQFIFTGHSLGAWLAQITTFALEYLEIVDSHFQKAVSEGGMSERTHAHTVVFDSPGCKPMLQKLKDGFDKRNSGGTIHLGELDITTYLSAPNLANTCNAHVGTLYRLKMAFPEMTQFEEIFMLTYTNEVHAIGGIVKALNGIKNNSNPDLEPELVEDWPILSVVKRLTKPIVKVVQIWFDPFKLFTAIKNIICKEDLISPENDELQNFFKLANHSNKYHIDLKAADSRAEIEKKGGYWSIRYQTKHADITWCKINAFSLKEQKFLTRYHTLRTFPGHLQCSEIFGMVKECKRKEIECSLKTFEIKDGYIEHGNLKRFIPYVQQLLHWHKGIHKATKGQMSPYEIKKRVYDNESEQFLKPMKESKPEYMDIKLENCWDSRVCHVIVQQETEMRAITHQIYHQHAYKADNQVYCTVLELKTLLKIDERSVPLKDFVISEEMAAHWFLVECKNAEYMYDEAYKMLGSILNELKKKTKVRFVFITIDGDRLSQFLQQKYKACMGDVLFHTIKDVGRIWKDLTKESQKVLSEKQLICYNGQNAKISLSGIFNSADDIAEIIESTKILNKLIQKEDITVSSESWRLHNTNTALYDKVTTKDQLVQAIKQSDDDSLFHIIVSTNVKNRDELLNGLNADDLKKICTPNGMDTESNEREWLEICSKQRGKLLYWCKFVTSDMIYCKLHFRRQIGVDINRVMKKSDDLYIISYRALDENAVSKIKQDYETMVLTEERSEKYFERLRKFVKSVHWYEFDQNQKLKWCKTDGLDARTLPDAVKMSALLEDNLANVKDPVVIIAGEPGMGKSTTLTRLAENWKEHWVIMSDLRSCEQQFNLTNDESTITIDDAVTFLLKGKNDGISSDFAKELLKRGLQGKTTKRPYLLFDGFDEIKGTVLEGNFVKLIQFLKKECKCHIWITTRKNCKEELEEHLSTTAVDLEEIERDEREKFLAAIWKNELLLQSNAIDLITFRAYAKEILHEAEKLLGSEKHKFLSSPLQLRMIAEAFFPDEKTIEMLSSNDVEINDKASSYQAFITRKYGKYFEDKTSLYQTFIKRKYDIYLEDKAGLISKTFKAPKQWCTQYLTKKHQILAFRMLYPNEASQHLYNFNAQDFGNDIKDMNHVGLIQSECNDQEYDFIHRTIAEFFVAKVMARWLSKPEGRHERLVKLLMSPITTEQLSKGVRSFLDEILKKFPVNKDSLMELCLPHMKAMCETKEHQILEKCCLILYVAAEEKLETVIEILFDCFKQNSEALINLISWRNKDGKTALYAAMEKGNERIVDQLLKLVQECSTTTQQELLYATCYRTSEENQNRVIRKLMDILKSYKMNQISEEIQKKWSDIPTSMNAARRGDMNKIRKLFPEDCKDVGSVYQKYLIAAVNKKQKTALDFAAMNGHEDIVTYLLQKGANANAKADLYSTPLHVAAKMGYMDEMKHLMANGADVNARNKSGKTPLEMENWSEFDKILHQICMEGEPIADLLNQVGPDNIEKFKSHANSYRDEDNRTPLHIASMNGNVEAVKWLWEERPRPDLNAKDNLELTPLHLAAEQGYIEVVKVLTKLGANLECKDVNGDTALHLATRAGNADIVEHLLQIGSNAIAKNYLGKTTLHVAVEKGHVEVTRCLLTKMLHQFCKKRGTIIEIIQDSGNAIEEFKKIVLSYRDKINSTPLHIASENGNAGAVRWLITDGLLDCNVINNIGLTPLHVAAKRGHAEVVKALTKLGANLECRDVNGDTALHLATRAGNADFVEHLLKIGANDSTNDDLPKTPLYVVVEKGHVDVVKCLIANGADINARNESGKTPLDIANRPIRQLMLNEETNIMFKPELDKMVNTFCKERDTTMKIIQDGCPHFEEFKAYAFFYQDKDNKTPLHIASMHGNIAAVKWLSGKGLDLNAKDNWGVTPLHRAAKRGHKEVVEVLKILGANLECKDNAGKTASQLTTDKDLQKLLNNEAADIAKNEQLNQVENDTQSNQVNQTFENITMGDDVDAEILAEVAESNLRNLIKWNLVKKMIKHGVNVKNLTADQKYKLLIHVAGNHKTKDNNFDPNNDSICKVIALNNVDILEYMTDKMREQNKSGQAVNAETQLTTNTSKIYEINVELSKLSNTMLQRLKEKPFSIVSKIKEKIKIVMDLS